MRDQLDSQAQALRRFNRFYTRRIGVLREGLLDSPFTLTEARVLYELAQGAPLTATAIARDLALDAGYLSRILSRFEARDLIEKRRAAHDGRQTLLALTPAGRAAFAEIDARSQDEMRALLSGLAEPRRAALIATLGNAQALLADTPEAPAYTLRPHRPGDMGWITHRHGALYAAEHGWDGSFEAMVAEIAAQFLRDFDPARERCWIAEQDGRVLGAIALVRGDGEGTAKLRLFYVEPEARGAGIGRHLVAECVAFAKTAGYDKITLWTYDALAAARRLYQAAGFTLARETREHSYGKDLVGQVWELGLR